MAEDEDKTVSRSQPCADAQERSPDAPAPPGEREPVTTIAELATLDETEMVEGYLDGFKGDPEPGDNRSKSYWHGWRNGHSDHTGMSDAAQRKLSHEVVRAKALGAPQ